ncbi:MAG: TonB-dependent receptor, partial [Verrucomicrobia bacterium]|nr:TonB-dependent receptor [Verrucomicrobiota bacterium]
YDRVDFDLADKRRPAAIVKDVYHNEAVTKQFGLNYKVTEPIMLYANRAESFVPPTSSGTTAINTGRRFLNERGLGYDAGVKLALFDGRLNATIGLFCIDRRNVRVTELEIVPVLDSQGRPVLNPATGQPQTTVTNVPLSSGLERSKGWEIDFNWKLTSDLQAFGGYGFADSYIIDAGRDLDAAGRPPRSVPRHKGGAGLRYALPASVLKGITLTLGATYTGEAFFQSPLSGGLVGADGYIREHNGRRNVMSPGYTVWNAGIVYRVRSPASAGTRLAHRLQLNAKNLFDLKHINSRVRAAPRLTLIGGYSLTF